jgi:hypothetical protein
VFEHMADGGFGPVLPAHREQVFAENGDGIDGLWGGLQVSQEMRVFFDDRIQRRRNGVGGTFDRDVYDGISQGAKGM